ncbi:MAG: DUF1365 domain-containing protein [Pseudomonadota bacterium]
MTASCLYAGTVMHRRFRPKRHVLRYRVFWLLLDLDEIGLLSRTLRLLRFERAGLASFFRSDHGDGSARPLRTQIEAQLAAAGIDFDGGPIRLLCMPRIFGYGFNPLSVYFCYRRDGVPAALIYQVHNTFGQRHSYVARIASSDGGVVEQDGDKRFYVSPFMAMDMRYLFRVGLPGERISVTIRNVDADGPILAAALSGTRKALNDRTLALALLKYPLMTLKVIVAIHWHALRLWWKGVPLVTRPDAPEQPVTVIGGQAFRDGASG